MIKSLINYCLIIAVICAGVWFYRELTNPNTLPIHQVVIQSTYQHVSQDELQQTIMSDVQGGLFSVNLSAISKQLRAIPWIASDSISRIWPDTLKIQLTEQHAIARWNNDALLNSKGELFKPSVATFPADLLWLKGPDDQVRYVLNMYKKMATLLTPIGITIQQLSLSGRGSWQVTLSNGSRLLLGRMEMLLRLRRYIAVYPKLFLKAKKKAEIVDLRYSTSMAVSWS